MIQLSPFEDIDAEGTDEGRVVGVGKATEWSDGDGLQVFAETVEECADDGEEGVEWYGWLCALSGSQPRMLGFVVVVVVVSVGEAQGWA